MNFKFIGLFVLGIIWGGFVFSGCGDNNERHRKHNNYTEGKVEQPQEPELIEPTPTEEPATLVDVLTVYPSFPNGESVEFHHYTMMELPTQLVIKCDGETHVYQKTGIYRWKIEQKYSNNL